MYRKILCLLCTEIDKPALKYPARYTGLNIIFEWTVQNISVTYCLNGLALVGTCRPSCSFSLLAAYKLNETGKLMTF